MKTLTFVLTMAAAAAVAAPARAQRPELPMWMIGSWLSCADGVQVGETWQGDARGMLLGTTLTIGERTGYDFQRIGPNAAGGISFFAQPGSAPVTEFAARPAAGDGRLVFENLAHDFPQRVIYWREGERLAARIEGMLEGRLESQDWRYSPAVPGQACGNDGTAGAVAAAERTFAADAAAHGWARAFREHHAPDALVLQPDPLAAELSLARIEGDGGTELQWRPIYAGASLSGDFGFTTGPFTIRGNARVIGHYFTVWQLQPGGAWQWIFDAGTDVVDDGTAPDAVQFLPLAEAGAGSAEAAIAAVGAIEASEGFALARHLRSDSRVNRVGAPPAVGSEASAALLARDGALAFRPLVRRAASAGDMVFSMGEVRDGEGEAERLRYFARIWQFGPDGWRVVFDEIVPRRT